MHWDIVSHELELVAESALGGGGEDCVEGEEEEIVIYRGCIGSLSISVRRSSFHSAETGGHSLEAVVWEELELEFRLDSRGDSMLVIIH